VGLTERDVANFWLNPANGVSYNIAVQTPQYRIDSLDALKRIPVNAPGIATPQLFENLASMAPQDEPAIISHYNIRPVIDIYGSVQGRDLGGISKDISRITVEAAEHLPRGSTLVTSEQVATMHSSFVGLFADLAFAIALVYLLLVVNFQVLDPTTRRPRFRCLLRLVVVTESILPSLKEPLPMAIGGWSFRIRSLIPSRRKRTPQTVTSG
jgi:multidrug efflux pump subunit AcrB